MPLTHQLTYRRTSDDPEIHRMSTDGVEIGSISLQSHNVHPVRMYRHCGLDLLPLMSHGGKPPSGDIEPPGGFEDTPRTFKEAFTHWRAGIPDDKWRENLEHKRAGQERWRK
jgi:hypothetical protein